MAVTERVESLKARHAAVDAQLQDLLIRPLPDADEITRLKREKLKLKDEMSKLHPH